MAADPKHEKFFLQVLTDRWYYRPLIIQCSTCNPGSACADWAWGAWTGSFRIRGSRSTVSSTTSWACSLNRCYAQPVHSAGRLIYSCMEVCQREIDSR